MLLLVGLGNPNPNNVNNRHNVGFLVIDQINKKFKLSKQKPKFKGLLTTGKIKVKFGGSSAGHNGIDSIDKNIGKNYSRVRIGIGRPHKKSEGADHVLENFSIDENDDIGFLR